MDIRVVFAIIVFGAIAEFVAFRPLHARVWSMLYSVNHLGHGVLHFHTTFAVQHHNVTDLVRLCIRPVTGQVSAYFRSDPFEWVAVNVLLQGSLRADIRDTITRYSRKFQSKFVPVCGQSETLERFPDCVWQKFERPNVSHVLQHVLQIRHLTNWLFPCRDWKLRLRSLLHGSALSHPGVVVWAFCRTCHTWRG